MPFRGGEPARGGAVDVDGEGGIGIVDVSVDILQRKDLTNHQISS